LIQHVRQQPAMKSKPILMLTTEGLAAKKEQGKAAGATGWIVKPFDPDKLLLTITKVLP
jgi:two-component system chemotaxis response regulator CheY